MELHAVCSVGEKQNSYIVCRQGNTTPRCQNHNPNDFEDDERPETCNKNNTDTLQRLKGYTAWLAKEWGRCRFRLLTEYDCLA
jgi:hypothetical protein